MNSQTNALTLTDSRQLAFADLGPRDASALLFFHGSGSSVDGLGLHQLAEQHNVRIVSPARPGIGGSSPASNRTLSDWAIDIAQLADHLDLDEFGVLGISGGGPYALAVAAGISGRVTRVGALSCGGPFEAPGALKGMARSNRIMWSAIERRPGLARFMLGQQAKLVNKNPAKATARVLKTLTGADARAVAELSLEEQHQFFAEPMIEALAHGPEAMFQDMAVLRRPWDFDIASVNQEVHLWHGSADTSAPVEMVRYLDEHIRGCELHVGADAGHLSTILNELDSALHLLS